MIPDYHISAAEWIVIGACVVVAFLLCVVGVIQLVPRARYLQRRLDLYKYLPVVRAIEESQARIELTAQRLSDAGVLLDRAQAALTKIQVAVASLVATATALSNAFSRVRSAVSWVARFFGRPSRGLRTRGS